MAAASSGRIAVILAGNPQSAAWFRRSCAAGRVPILVAMAPDLHDLVRRERLELNRCLRLLAEAIAQADRWYARREAELAAFDRRARTGVDRLRAEHRINSSMVWHTA
jgi:hypothetical protein